MNLDRARSTACAFVCACALTCAAARADVTVTSSNLACGINAANGDSYQARFRNVTSPFSNSHSASDPASGSSASASYNFTFGGSTFDFQTTNTLVASGSPGPSILDSLCTGTVGFTTTSDFLLSVDFSFTYALGAGEREADYVLHVSRAGPVDYYSSHGEADPTFGDPAAATWSDHSGPILLPAGQYGMGYSFGLRSLAGSAVGSLSNGNTMLHVTLAPVPEPGTIGFLALALISSRRRLRLRVHSGPFLIRREPWSGQP